MTNQINIKEVKANQQIQFGDHHHTILNDEINFSGFKGIVVSNKKLLIEKSQEIIIKLFDPIPLLDEWDNCLIFNFPSDDHYDDVQVTIIMDNDEEIYSFYPNNSQHNINYQRSDNVSGTSLKGYIKANYYDLLDKLPKSIDNFDDFKCDVEWGIQFSDGTKATLYNYKNGKNYLGDKGKDLKDMTQWNVGGNSPKAVEYLATIIDAEMEYFNI